MNGKYPGLAGSIHINEGDIVPNIIAVDILTFSTAISLKNNLETPSKQGKTAELD